MVLTVFLWGEVGAASPQRKHPNKKTVKKTPCDFKVDINEVDFYVVKGAGHDIDVTLIPTAGVCEGSAILNVSGLPAGATYKILPSPKMRFIRGPKTSAGTAVATVRIDTANMTLEAMATSSISFIASKKSLIRKAKADITIDLPNEETAKEPEPSCDFEVGIKETDFCVVNGAIHDIDVTLTPTAGVCGGSATISVSGLPSRATYKVLPSPKMRFISDPETPAGTAVATVRIDTSSMMLEEIATSSLIFTASQKSLIRKTKADMTIDLPAFNFSIKPSPTLVRLHQEDVASTTVKVKLLGAACQSPRPITLSLDPASLPSFVSYDFSSSSVVPSGESTISFKTESGPDIGPFNAKLIGCCLDDDIEKTSQITVDVLFPRSLMEDSSHEPFAPGEFKVDSRESIMEKFNLPLELRERARKDAKDEAEKGYMDGTEEEVQELKRSKMLVRPMDQVFSLLRFEPVSLKGTPFELFRLEGGYPDNGDMNGNWSTAIRIFTMPNGFLVELTERNFYMSGGGGGYIAREALNENVNGSPATLFVQQSKSGNALSGISWNTSTTSYLLRMEGNVRKNGQYNSFLDIARSIPIDYRSEDQSKKDGNGDIR
jgi:hypothetical protein